MLIELIGLPGSGKSTLYQNIIKNYDLSKYLIGFNDIFSKALYEFITNNKSLMSPLNYNLYSIINTIPFVKKKVANCFFSTKVIFSLEAHSEIDYSLVSEIVLDNMENDYYDNCQKVNLIKWEFEKLIRAQILKRFSVNYNNNILLDEGIITVLNNIQNKDNYVSLLDKIALPDAVIFLDSDIDFVVNVSLDRKKNSRYNVGDINLNKEIDFFSKKQTRYYYLIELLQNQNIPIIRINRDSELSCILDFVQDIS